MLKEETAKVYYWQIEVSYDDSDIEDFDKEISNEEDSDEEICNKTN